MKDRELFLDKIKVNSELWMQVDDTKEVVNIYRNEELIDQFSLRKRIHTFFKTLQTHTNAPNSINDLYGNQIDISDSIYMVASNKHEHLVVKFYKREVDIDDRLLYLTKMNYMTQKLFHRMLIPQKVLDNPKYPMINPNTFKDLIDILGMITI